MARSPALKANIYNMTTAFFSENPIATIRWEEWSRPPLKNGPGKTVFRMKLTNAVSRIGIKHDQARNRDHRKLIKQWGTPVRGPAYRPMPDPPGQNPINRLPASPMNIEAGLKLYIKKTQQTADISHQHQLQPVWPTNGYPA